MNTPGDELQFVAFRVGPQEFAVNIFQVERIIRYERPAMLPGTPDFLEGVVRYGGGVVPVVDLRKRLSVPADHREEVRMMVLELETQRVAIVVDQVLEVLRIDAALISAPPPMVRGLAAVYISGIVAQPDRTIILLNAARLLNSEERLALAAMEA
ncbi:MAG: chemotaxis protein CheW [Gemmatimonadota bacterium]